MALGTIKISFAFGNRCQSAHRLHRDEFFAGDCVARIEHTAGQLARPAQDTPGAVNHRANLHSTNAPVNRFWINLHLES